MKIATWNVNSLKVRLPQVLDWLAAHSPDALCLQETKLEDKYFPADELSAAGYHLAFAGQKTYNGVALLTRQPMHDIVYGNPLFPDPQQRLIAATVEGVRLVCVYIPNGQAVGSDKYTYKMEWLAALQRWLADTLQQTPQLALCGDFNIAPTDADVHDPAAWAGQILCSDAERAAFQNLCALGLQDSFRHFPQAPASFSWWDYRMLGFQKNRGLRIDHILLSNALIGRAEAAGIDRAPRKSERPSDHAPAWVNLS